MAWKNIKLGKKILLGIGLVLALMIVISVWSWTGIDGIVKDAKELSGGNKLVGILLQREIDHLNWAGDLNKLLTDDTVTEMTVQTDHTQCGFGKWLYGEGRKNAEAFLPVLKTLFKSIEGPHEHLHRSAIKIGSVYKAADRELPMMLANRETDHLAWSEKVQSAVLQRKDNTGVELDHKACAFGKFLYGPAGSKIQASDPELARLMEAVKTPHEKLHQTGRLIDQALGQNQFRNAQRIYQDETTISLAATRSGLKKLQEKAMQNLEGEHLARAIYAKETQANLSRVQAILNEVIKTTKNNVISEDQMVIKATTTGIAVMVISIIAIIIGVAVAFLIARAITQPIKKVVAMMKELQKGNFGSRANIVGEDEIGQMARSMDECGAELQNAVDDISRVMTAMEKGDLAQRVEVDCKGELDVLKNSINKSLELLGQTIDHSKTATVQVNTSAEELSQSAQSLATGATEQAASLEEISSSMAEIGSRAKDNDENATQAESISNQAIHEVQNGNEQMSSMLESMKEIDINSSSVTKVIKVIDEIAFQTNLLALNAAVEAARAGKYGKGFAVVAEEVRSLAGRSADAARETNELIEKSVAEVSNGVKKADITAEVLQNISGSVMKVNDLVGEITASSREQRNSIDEINRGLSTMNDVVQENSSIAEETAAASEELSGQSTELQGLMGRFQTVEQHDTASQAFELLPPDSVGESQEPVQHFNNLSSRRLVTLEESKFKN